MHSIAWWPSVIVLSVATITDLRSRRIPNWLVLPFMAAGIVVSAVSHGWHGIAQSLMGLAWAPCSSVFSAGWAGWGWEM